jgi:hypothetical protein
MFANTIVSADADRVAAIWDDFQIVRGKEMNDPVSYDILKVY